MIFLSCYFRSGDEDESPETKAERERLRRQANNARERFVKISSYSIVFKHSCICLKPQNCPVSNFKIVRVKTLKLSSLKH